MTRDTRNRLLNSLPNDLRAVIVELNKMLDTAAHEFKGGAVTDGQYTTFLKLLNYTVGAPRDDNPANV